MHHSAVIFDVDGPLLHLTDAEAEAFFVPLRDISAVDHSLDWDSYRIRNDVEIYRDILGMSGDAIMPYIAAYLSTLDTKYQSGEAAVTPIPRAQALLETLSQVNGLALGTATANFEAAAKMRLTQAGMWPHVQHFHSGAEPGGHKRDILARVIARLDLPAERIVYLGDNLNDLDAAQANGTHFIGFHTDTEKRARLTQSGAKTVTGDHTESLRLIRYFLDL